jgi:tRNA threonylcarbamoyl adenosine modification protein (Sua5/YciO/YrdC/YwlC family)
MLLPIHPINPEPRHIRRVAETLRAGGIIIYPTDTVYGIGCSVEDKDAIERVYQIKRVRADKPFSFVCSDLKNISEYAHVSNRAFRTIKHLVPGPYTFILPATRMKQLPKILVSKRKTVGIRVPDHRITQAIVKELGHPILSTSVTDPETGEILNDPARIQEGFGNQVDLVIDGGVLVSEASTVLDLTGEEMEIVRKGAGEIPSIG